MKKQLFKVISLIMAISLLCSCGTPEDANSSANETSNIPESSFSESVGNEETSIDETPIISETPAPETSSVPETEITTTTSITAETPAPETTKAETTTTTTTVATPKPETTIKPVDKPISSSKKLAVVGKDGYSDLKSGSGIGAAATVLGYYGVDIRPLKLREYADIHGTSTIIDGFTPSPWDVIVDEPIGPNALYYAKPIIDMVHNYLNEIGNTSLKARDISGATLSQLTEYIDKGKPVIVWGTSDGWPAEDTISWILPNGEKFIAKGSMKVYTLIGYTETEVIVLGDTGYELNVSNEIFLTMYESIYSQAILIE